MIDITIKHLRYFEALARHRHFGRAAEDCGISQPALSVQMKALEDMLATPLIERGAKHLRLTSFGETFLDRVREILQAVDALGDLARASHQPLVGRFRFGIIPTAAPYFLPRFIKCLTQNYPGLDLRPREAVTQKLIEGLLGGSLDTAIVALPMSEPSLHEEALFDEDFVLVRARAEADSPVPSAKLLREMRLLLLEEGHCFRDQALSYCSTPSSLPRDLMEGSSLSTLVQMVGAGIGVTLIPEMAVAIETRSASVSVARLASPRPSRTIGMVWRKTNPLAEQLGDIAQMVRQACLDAPANDAGNIAP
ncbi:MAG: LysR family transcriptional regulator [Thalassobium sp.]|uniref:hydrogen peroxide-inducible genes activator n=1 Tax=Octadecabacter sp. SW4 TaxID=2602067 RepID=UPI000C0DC825|nr:hydrogen peroxide-inducible genes activator [Octadecabacter sp. SW4]PHQ80084.1 MAG: LysR family transcriptional regulator [Thalassobium sp.]QEE35909.1 hydrogen peroxide-inducible genes activator [Octadecabacter sp. SW4]|tara:strand:- start:555 stop:1478 length:924 start_codon:yes stop_codon:yes gene_type:complete